MLNWVFLRFKGGFFEVEEFSFEFFAGWGGEITDLAVGFDDSVAGDD